MEAAQLVRAREANYPPIGPGEKVDFTLVIVIAIAIVNFIIVIVVVLVIAIVINQKSCILLFVLLRDENPDAFEQF